MPKIPRLKVTLLGFSAATRRGAQISRSTKLSSAMCSAISVAISAATRRLAASQERSVLERKP